MHVPDGIIPLWLQLFMSGLTLVFLVLAVRTVNRKFDTKMVPYLGVLAAAIFAAQFVNFPIGNFSSGHLVGSTLLAVLVGPWAAMLIMALVLFVQALYGDGGLLTYGLNFFNMGIVATLVGWSVVLLSFRLLRRVTAPRIAVITGAGVGSFISIVAAAVVLGIELLTVPGFGTEAFTVLTLIHVVIALGEAAITVAVILYFLKAKPSIISLLDESETRDLAHEPLRRALVPEQTIRG
ncbi:MAG: energy-coupling factor ABC transporter permease [Candidatus Thorarchaeota archaeon]